MDRFHARTRRPARCGRGQQIRRHQPEGDDTLPADLRASLYMDNIAEWYDKILMWKNVPNMDKWLQVWQEATAS